MDTDHEVDSGAAQRFEQFPAITPAACLTPILVQYKFDAWMSFIGWKSMFAELIRGRRQGCRRTAPLNRRIEDRFRGESPWNKHRRFRTRSKRVRDDGVESDSVAIDIWIARHLCQKLLVERRRACSQELPARAPDALHRQDVGFHASRHMREGAPDLRSAEIDRQRSLLGCPLSCQRPDRMGGDARYRLRPFRCLWDPVIPSADVPFELLVSNSMSADVSLVERALANPHMCD